MSIHDGHRQRLKQRFLEEGLESFTDIQVLELLLFFSVPRQDSRAATIRVATSSVSAHRATTPTQSIA